MLDSGVIKTTVTKQWGGCESLCVSRHSVCTKVDGGDKVERQIIDRYAKIPNKCEAGVHRRETRP